MDLLEKVELALANCEKNGTTEAQLNLSFAELRLIRRYELLDNYNHTLSIENLRAAKDFRDKQLSSKK